MFYQFLLTLLLSIHYLTHPPTWGRGIDKRAAIYSGIIILIASKFIDNLLVESIYNPLIWIISIIFIYMIIYRYQIVRDAHMMAIWKMQRSKSQIKKQMETQTPNRSDDFWGVKRSRVTIFDTNIDLIQVTKMAKAEPINNLL